MSAFGISCQTYRDVKPSSLIDSYLIGGTFCLDVLVSVYQTTRSHIPGGYLDTDNCDYISFHTSFEKSVFVGAVTERQLLRHGSVGAV
jgi:hypothetical protein